METELGQDVAIVTVFVESGVSAQVVDEPASKDRQRSPPESLGRPVTSPLGPLVPLTRPLALAHSPSIAPTASPSNAANSI